MFQTENRWNENKVRATEDFMGKMSNLVDDKKEKGDWTEPSNVKRFGRDMGRTYPKNAKDGKYLIQARDEYILKLELKTKQLEHENSKLRQENNQKDEYIKELEARLQS